MPHDEYQNPLVNRYASEVMSRLWGDQRKFSTWRRLWWILADAQRQLGLPITQAQLNEMRAHQDDIDFEAATRYERRLRHDVMAHVHTFGDCCPQAKPIIHLGATSCYVTDNTDLILIREGLGLVAARLAKVIATLGDFASQYRGLACLAMTHLQPAQPTTVGKRAALWASDLVHDLESIEWRRDHLRARGVKGTTGTQASFLQLFNGDHRKVELLDNLVSQAMGFAAAYPITGQTYSRKIDTQVLAVLSELAQSAHKIATDIRILASRKELEEPYEADQIGSSAMAYKRNPMRSERICALSRYLMSLYDNMAHTAATQWLERTLDDSANRRIVIPQAFLAADAILITLQNIAEGLVVYPAVIARHLNEELPFMATEQILMAAVQAGGDRQALHERIRQHSQAAARMVKEHGAANDLMDRLRRDDAFASIDLEHVVDVNAFVGRAPEQVDEFVRDVVEPIRRRYETQSVAGGEVRV
ncbi:MAG TPA: adenylosuccinate lyase [Pirellulaceae bacterium]|nr:adenylosuccinate lyase [Pirellulaceae bacterium]